MAEQRRKFNPREDQREQELMAGEPLLLVGLGPVSTSTVDSEFPHSTASLFCFNA
ncbi:hypothetical protein SAY87_024282 [Trapa incisa]|uniref:Uncharacterized protein n=1 Tax=Trapa incisa TaxID=236973 RepID=A0AAN7JF19_9MYRT|nr:hypothetical protein SAY87_024282 [Trapa incisa]